MAKLALREDVWIGGGGFKMTIGVDVVHVQEVI